MQHAGVTVPLWPFWWPLWPGCALLPFDVTVWVTVGVTGGDLAFLGRQTGQAASQPVPSIPLPATSHLSLFPLLPPLLSLSHCLLFLCPLHPFAGSLEEKEAGVEGEAGELGGLSVSWKSLRGRLFPFFCYMCLFSLLLSLLSPSSLLPPCPSNHSSLFVIVWGHYSICIIINSLNICVVIIGRMEQDRHGRQCPSHGITGPGGGLGTATGNKPAKQTGLAAGMNRQPWQLLTALAPKQQQAAGTDRQTYRQTAAAWVLTRQPDPDPTAAQTHLIPPSCLNSIHGKQTCWKPSSCLLCSLKPVFPGLPDLCLVTQQT